MIKSVAGRKLCNGVRILLIVSLSGLVDGVSALVQITLGTKQATNPFITTNDIIFSHNPSPAHPS